MKTLCSFILFISCALSLSAQTDTSYDLNVGEFSELRVSDGINVDYTSDPDKAGRAFFNCPAQQASSFMFTNKGGRLTIQLSPEIIGARNLPTITVHSKHLTKVENTSDSTVRVLSLNGLPKLEARLEGNGHLIVRGIDATEVKGTLRLGHGTLILTTVNAKGTGSVGVNAVSALGVYGMGSTSVYYIGSPEIKNRSVGLKLMPLSK